MKKAKLIHLEESVFKTLYKNAIDRGMSLKALIEGLLKNYADFVSKPITETKKTDKEEPINV